MGILKYYDGFTYHVLQGTIHGSVLILGFYWLENIRSEGEGYLNMIGYNAMIGLIASFLSYPIDTYKRLYQYRSLTSPDINFKQKYAILPLYRYIVFNKFSGFQFFLLRNIPFTLLQYQFYTLLVVLTQN